MIEQCSGKQFDEVTAFSLIASFNLTFHDCGCANASAVAAGMLKYQNFKTEVTHDLFAVLQL